MLKNLKQLWRYSDSQPTEITLGAALAILAPICTIIELGFMPFYQLSLIAAGEYPETEQRLAVCYRSWSTESKKTK